MTPLSALLAIFCLLALNAPAQELPGESLGLIPEVPLPVEKPKAAPAAPLKKSTTEQAGDDLKSLIRYREVKTKALQDPRLQQEWDRAQAAKTDPEKREALKRYYDLFCERMVKIDASVKPRVEAFRRALVWRIEPGGPARAKEIPPTDEPLAEDTQIQIR